MYIPFKKLAYVIRLPYPACLIHSEVWKKVLVKNFLCPLNPDFFRLRDSDSFCDVIQSFLLCLYGNKLKKVYYDFIILPYRRDKSGYFLILQQPKGFYHRYYRYFLDSCECDVED